MLGMCNALNSRGHAYPYQWAGENVQIFLKKISLIGYPANDHESAVLDLKLALQLNPKQKFYFNKQAKIKTKKKLPYKCVFVKTPHRFLCRNSLWQ